MNSYHKKYLKYKNKYLELKNKILQETKQIGGDDETVRQINGLVQVEDKQIISKVLNEIKEKYTKEGISLPTTLLRIIKEIIEILKKGFVLISFDIDNETNIIVSLVANSNGKNYTIKFHKSFPLGPHPNIISNSRQDKFVKDKWIDSPVLNFGLLAKIIEEINEYNVDNLGYEYYYPTVGEGFYIGTEKPSDGVFPYFHSSNLHFFGHKYKLPDDMDKIINNYFYGYFRSLLYQADSLMNMNINCKKRFDIDEGPDTCNNIIDKVIKLTLNENPELFLRLVKLYFNGKVREEVNENVILDSREISIEDKEQIKKMISDSKFELKLDELGIILNYITNLYIRYIYDNEGNPDRLTMGIVGVLNSSRELSEEQVIGLFENTSTIDIQLSYIRDIVSTDENLNEKLNEIERVIELFNSSNVYKCICKKYKSPKFSIIPC